MKTKYIFASFLLSSLAFAGCEDMDTLPEGNIVTSTQKDEIGAMNPDRVEARVNAIFAQFSQMTPNKGALKAERHNDFGYPSVMLFTDTNGNDVVSDDNGYNWTGNDLDYTDRSQTSLECQMVWNDMYSIVYASNNVIKEVDASTTDATEQFYLGQGLGARAFSYWVLAQLYQFNYKGNENKPCVPLITEKNMEEAGKNGSPRSTVQAVYTQITADLTSAIDLLEKAEEGKVKRKDKRYISLAVAYGLQARVYLTMHEYTLAATAADNAIKAAEKETIVPAGLTDVNQPAFWSVNEKNWMWGIIINETDEIVDSGIVNWPSHMGSFSYGYANFSGGRQISKALYKKIADTDIRKGWWLGSDIKSKNLTAAQQAMITSYGYGAYTQVKFAPYNNVLETAINANDIPLMRVEEMYLIKAEAEAMSGGNGRATLENFIKTYRNAEYVVNAGVDIQEEVFLQRRIELWGEGLNWFDLMRLNKGVDRRGAGFPNANMIFNIAANDPVLLWPIPEAEIQANQALTTADQNPSWTAPKEVEDK